MPAQINDAMAKRNVIKMSADRCSWRERAWPRCRCWPVWPRTLKPSKQKR